MKKIKINIDKSKITDILVLAVKRKRLIFILFLGILLIYNFNLLYNNLYLNINYIDYSGLEEDFGFRKENVLIKNLKKDIDGRVERIEEETSKEYASPFEFKDLEKTKSDGADDRNSDGSNYSAPDPGSPIR